MKIFSLSKLREGLQKTRTLLSNQFSKILLGNKKLTDDEINKLKETLLLADFGSSFSEHIIEEAENSYTKNKLDISIQELVQQEIIKSLSINSELNNNFELPHVIMVVGINGVGKTTTVAKIANIFLKKGKKVLIGAADTFRAAANEQLTIWAERVKVEIISQKPGADPSAVAFDTLQSAIARNFDVVIIDTAGRLHTKANLMNELSKMKRALKKLIPTAPHEILFVLDASTGQNGVQQAKIFNDALRLTGIIVTKLDGTAKGGIVVNIVHQLKIPISYIGVGEQLEDLQEFDAQTYTNELFKIPDEVN